MTLSSITARLPITPVAIALSCLFSLLVILQNPLLNNDAYGYLLAAETFSARGADATLGTFGWYGYSILIAVADYLLPGDLITAAHLLNTAAYALLVYAFIEICAEYRDTRRLRVFAALSILLFPLTNEMRYFLIRDTAFWAFALLSLLQLLRFNRGGDWEHALWWCLAVLAAVAFRLEALLLLVLTPLALVLQAHAGGSGMRWLRAGQLLGVMAWSLLGATLLAWVQGLNLLELAAYAYRYYLPLLGNLGSGLGDLALGANAALFTPDNFPGGDNLPLGLAVVLFANVLALLAQVIQALSPPLTLVLLYGFWRKDLALPLHARRPLQGYLLAALLALLLFLFIMHFLTQRYVTLLCLLLLTLLPLLLDALHERLATSARLRYTAALGFCCLYYGIDSLFSFGYSKQHIEDAVAWSRDNLPPNAVLQTNVPAIAWGSGLANSDNVMVRSIDDTLRLLRFGDYLALELKHDEVTLGNALDADNSLQPLAHFNNERDDELRVYRRR